MALLNTRWLVAGTALGLFLALSGLAKAEENAKVPKAPVAELPFDISNIDTFAGAMLAGRTADNDYDYPSAIKLYRTALKYQPDTTEIRERLMISLFMNGDFDQGVIEAEKLKTDPAVERIGVISRSIAAIRDKHFTDAYALLKYDGPNELDRMINILLTAWGQFGEGKEKEAIATVDKMTGPDWYSVFQNYNEGMIAAAAGDIETARAKLNEAVADREQGAAASDTYMRAVMALASLEASAGNKQKALDAISTGELFAPGYMPLQAFRKKIEAGEKPPVGVTSATQGASAVLFSVGAALNQSLTNAPDREGAQDIVAFYLVTAFSLDQNASDAAILLGGLAENNNHPEQAIEWYRKVPLTSPLRRTADLQLGLNLATTGKVDDAKRHLQSAIAADPTDVRGYISYGSLLSDNKDYQEMAKNYDKAVDVLGPFPDRADWSVFFQRGIAYERLKRWPEAEPNFKKALELYPDQPQVLNYLGYSWVDMNIHLDEGLAMIRKAVDLRPDDGYIVDSLGWAYYRLGRYDDAVSELEHAVELKSADATINDHLGDAYWRAGRKLEAIFQWRIALDMKGDDLDRDLVKKKIREGLPPAEIHAEVKQSTPVAVDKVAQNQPATADDSTTKPAATDDGKTAKPANDQQPSTSAAQTSHTVVKGDSLWNIAKGLLGNGQRFIEIIHLNPELKRHPDIIRPGQMLKLPDGKM